MAVPKEGKDGEHSTRRNLKNRVKLDGTNNTNSNGGSSKYRTKRSLKGIAGGRQLAG